MLIFNAFSPITAPGGSIILDSSDKTAELYKKAVFQDQDSPSLIKTQYEVCVCGCVASFFSVTVWYYVCVLKKYIF